MRRLLLAAALLLALPAHVPEAAARSPDIAGARDHPLVGRYEGARIARFQERAFEEVRLIDKPLVAPDGPRRNDRNSRAVEGRQLRITYEGPAGRSALEMFRNHQQALAQRGFEQVFVCAGAACGPGMTVPGAVEGVAGAAGLPQVIEGQRYGLFRLARDSGAVWVALYANERPAVGNRPLAPFVFVEVVEERPMQAGQIQFVDATAMGRAIDATGRVALFGLIVAGHTDSQGGFDYNVEFSRRRAAAVVAALARDHGVAAARLTPFGAGPAAPVAANDTDEGRARNRRVELVKR